MTDINFKNGMWMIDYTPVKNPTLLVYYLKQKFGYSDETIAECCASNGKHYFGVCPIHYVMDGGLAFICGIDLDKYTPVTKCNCGVPLDVHGTCCEWGNAKHVCNEHGIIVDDRHPYYGKNVNDWFNHGSA